MAEDYFTPYEQVKSTFENFRRGSNELDFFSCKFSRGHRYKLSDEFNLDESEENLPRIAYDGSTSTLIIENAGALQESVCRLFNNAFHKSLPTSKEALLVCYMNLDFVFFGGNYEDSEKLRMR